MGGFGRSVVSGFAGVLLVVAAAAAATVTSAGAVPQQASGDSPTVVVTPDQDIADGQQVLVEMSGFPGAIGAVVVCSASVADAPPTADTWSSCQMLTIPTDLPPSQATVWVPSVFETGLFGSDGEFVNCHQAPGCVVGFMTADVSVAAFTPVSFGPDISATLPQRNLEAGSTIEVVGGDIPAGEWSIAQCGRDYVDDPTPARAAALCAPSTSVSPDSDGAFIADLVVQDPLTSSSGTEVPCGYNACVVVLKDGGDPLVSDVAISFGPTRLTVTPAEDLVDGDQVWLDVSGIPLHSYLDIDRCLLPLGPTRATSRCTDLYGVPSEDQWGDARLRNSVDVSIDDPDDCRPDACAFVLFADDGDVVGDPVAITFAPVAMTFDPTSELLDGQDISVTGQNLSGDSYRLHHCKDALCGTGTAGTLDRGTFTGTVPAEQRFSGSGGELVYCRVDECHVELRSFGRGTVASSSYELVTGQVEAAPDTGLSDGETVEISGTDLMPSYDGPNLWIFPTGGWTLTQCDAVVLDDLSVIGMFTHCAAAPTSREVTVEGSTLDTSLDVESEIDKILGGTTDCAASPGACVAGLVRLEQDGSVSAHLTPLTFDP